MGPMRKLTFVLLAALLAAPAFAASKKLIHPKEFAKGRPFSPGIMVGNTLYVAGQVGQDLKTTKIPEDFEAEVKQDDAWAFTRKYFDFFC